MQALLEKVMVPTSQSRISGTTSQAQGDRLPAITPTHALSPTQGQGTQRDASSRMTAASGAEANGEDKEKEKLRWKVTMHAINFARIDDNVRIEEQINLRHLQQLKVLFQEHKVTDTPDDEGHKDDWWRSKDEIHERQPGELSRQEFKDALSQVLGTHDYDHQLDVLFSKLDTSDDGFVDWDEFCTYMLLQLRENDFLASRTQRPFQSEAKIKHIVYNKQETTSRIVAMDCPLRFITVSKEGAICFWHPSLNLERHTMMSVGDGDGRTAKRRVKTWVTDAVFMSNCRKLAICTTGRDIRFYDIASQNCDEQFQLFGLSNVPCCMYYYCDVKTRNVTAESTLIYGDDSGALNVLQFHNPGTQLFNAPFKKEQGVQQVFMQELAQYHTKWVHHTSVEGVHPEAVQKVFYMPDNQTAMSSCKGQRASLVITDIPRSRKAYVFNILKGVECFDYSKNLNTVATGSSDHIVRLWNPYVPKRPVAVLEGHAVSIVDVVIHESSGLLLSYSKDAMIRVWDLKEQVCIQITTVKFPCTLNGRFAEHGPFALHLQADRPTNGLLVAAGDYIAMLRMGEGTVTTSSTPTTHLTQLCAAIYNPYFKQVITGADDSSIGMWDVNTGMKALMFTKCHGNEEITALSFDATFKKLVTGARDGTVKVWNVQNGHNLHKLAPVSEAEVTGVLMLTERDTVISVGWNRYISTYDISQKENINVDADIGWKGGQRHKEDILAMAFLPPTLIATASFDGEIYVWSLETEKVYIQLRKSRRIFPKPAAAAAAAKPEGTGQGGLFGIGATTGPESPKKSQTPQPSRPNSRHRLTHRPEDNQPVPVDKLLFLPRRATEKRTESALLISSEAGVLYWWSLYRAQPKAGEFYAPHQPDDSVLGLCSDPGNTQLITGDSVGQISVWDITDYCVGPQAPMVTSRPPLLHTWHAHDTCTVSVDYVNHDTCGAFIVSASTDKTAKLWTIEGCCVGVFGQKDTWDLREPTTWVDPRAEELTDPADLPETEINIEVTSGDEGEGGYQQQPGEGGGAGDDVTAPPSRARSNSSHVTVTAVEPGAGVDGRKSALITETRSRAPSVVTPLRPTTVDNLQLTVSRENTMDSRTPDPNRQPPAKENMLGYKAETHLVKRQQDRAERRDTYGEMASAKTSRMGSLCCPFGALTMQSLSDCDIPKNLPVTTRMLHRGYNPATMTKEKLTNMNLALFPNSDVILTTSDMHGPNAGPTDGKHTPHTPGTATAASTRRHSVARLPDIRKHNKPVAVKR